MIVNESGLYDIVLDSRKPEAKRFRRWITKEVLPAIRKTGKYELPQISNLSEDDKRLVLREEIPKRITIDERYLKISKIKQEAKIEQIIRNLKSNKNSFISLGYAIDIRGGFQITKKGLEFVKEEFKEFL